MKKISLFFAVFVTILVIPWAVFAASSSSSSSSLSSSSSSISTAACTLQQQKLQEKVSQISLTRSKQFSKFSSIRSRLAKFSIRLHNTGYDTTTLDADLQTYARKLSDYNNDYSNFIKASKDAKDALCLGDAATAKTKLQITRDSLVTLKDQAKSTKDYLGTLKSDLEAIKKQKPKK